MTVTKQWFLISDDLNKTLREQWETESLSYRDKMEELQRSYAVDHLFTTNQRGTVAGLAYRKDQDVPHHMRKTNVTSRVDGIKYVEVVPNRRTRKGKELESYLLRLNAEILQVGTVAMFITRQLGMYRETSGPGHLYFSTAGTAYAGGPMVISVPYRDDEEQKNHQQKGVLEIKEWQYIALRDKDLTAQEIWDAKLHSE